MKRARRGEGQCNEDEKPGIPLGSVTRRILNLRGGVLDMLLVPVDDRLHRQQDDGLRVSLTDHISQLKLDAFYTWKDVGTGVCRM